MRSTTIADTAGTAMLYIRILRIAAPILTASHRWGNLSRSWWHEAKSINHQVPWDAKRLVDVASKESAFILLRTICKESSLRGAQTENPFCMKA